jgi:hypothetical protein
MFAIEKKVTTDKKNTTWERVSEWSTRDLAVNRARMQFGTRNQFIRIVDTEAAAKLTENPNKRR